MRTHTENTNELSQGTVNTSQPSKKRQPSLTEEILYLLIKLTIVILVVILLFSFVFGAMRCNGNNMSPAIREGDMIIFYRLDREYNVSDTIVIKKDNEYQLQRVVAVSGDTVDVAEGGLIINGSYQVETNIYTATERYTEGIEFPITLKDGEVFVLSDNRPNATDSRIYGPIRVEDTCGTVMAVLRRRNI